MLNSATQPEMTEGELLNRLSTLGLKVDPHQFRTWRRHRLTPPSVRVRQGGRGVGPIAYYAESAVPHLRALHVLFQESPKNLARVGYHLWALGYPTPQKYWKKRLKAAPERFAKFLSQIEDSECPGEFNDKATAAFERAAQTRNNKKAMGPVRRRLRQKGFRMLLEVIVKAALGNFQPEGRLYLQQEEREEYTFVFDRLLGLAQGKKKARIASAPSLIVITAEAFKDKLQTIASIFEQRRNLLKGCTNEQIFRARDELAWLFFLIRQIAQNECEKSHSSTPLEFLVGLIEDTQKFLDLHVLCIGVWVHLSRDPETRSGLQKINLEIRSTLNLEDILPNQVL